jgi:hypothetical protein
MRKLHALASGMVSLAGAAAAQTFLTVSLPQRIGSGKPPYVESEYFVQEVSQPWNVTVSDPTPSGSR